MLTDFAPAKVNLTLRVRGKRPDGYHDIECLVAFADIGDTLALVPDAPLDLEVDGATAVAAGPTEANLVLRAARALARRVPGLRLGRFVLTKRLPVAAGLGGGSSDAAAALRLIARANALAPGDPRVMQAARETGADVPVCLDPRARVIQGVGDRLSEPLDLPRLPVVLVNTGVPLPTGDVFERFDDFSPADAPQAADDALPHDTANAEGLLRWLASQANDLEPAAVSLQPTIARVIAALRANRECKLARMSGSGATCFGVFGSGGEAADAARRIEAAHPDWWVRAATLR
jgi:4-diphosphocytidyl-2-C-methyl-D-erythritol kinase